MSWIDRASGRRAALDWIANGRTGMSEAERISGRAVYGGGVPLVEALCGELNHKMTLPLKGVIEEAERIQQEAWEAK